MCHSTAGLVARELELRGVATVVVGTMRSRLGGLPRALVTSYRDGPAGPPGASEVQRAIVQHALDLIRMASGSVLEIFTPTSAVERKRSGDPPERGARSTMTPVADGSQAGAHRRDMQELDVRTIPPRDKHPTIHRLLDQLAEGEVLRLLNDHEPRPLRYELEADRPGAFEWNYLESGPELWRVEIRKLEHAPAKT